MDFVDQFSSSLSIELASFLLAFGIEEGREDDGFLLLSLEQFTIRIRAPSFRTTD